MKLKQEEAAKKAGLTDSDTAYLQGGLTGNDVTVKEAADNEFNSALMFLTEDEVLKIEKLREQDEKRKRKSDAKKAKGKLREGAHKEENASNSPSAGPTPADSAKEGNHMADDILAESSLDSEDGAEANLNFDSYARSLIIELEREGEIAMLEGEHEMGNKSKSSRSGVNILNQGLHQKGLIEIYEDALSHKVLVMEGLAAVQPLVSGGPAAKATAHGKKLRQLYMTMIRSVLEFGLPTGHPLQKHHSDMLRIRPGVGMYKTGAKKENSQEKFPCVLFPGGKNSGGNLGLESTSVIVSTSNAGGEDSVRAMTPDMHGFTFAGRPYKPENLNLPLVYLPRENDGGANYVSEVPVYQSYAVLKARPDCKYGKVYGAPKKAPKTAPHISFGEQVPTLFGSPLTRAKNAKKQAERDAARLFKSPDDILDMKPGCRDLLCDDDEAADKHNVKCLDLNDVLRCNVQDSFMDSIQEMGRPSSNPKLVKEERYYVDETGILVDRLREMDEPHRKAAEQKKKNIWAGLSKMQTVTAGRGAMAALTAGGQDQAKKKSEEQRKMKLAEKKAEKDAAENQTDQKKVLAARLGTGLNEHGSPNGSPRHMNMDGAKSPKHSASNVGGGGHSPHQGQHTHNGQHGHYVHHKHDNDHHAQGANMMALFDKEVEDEDTETLDGLTQEEKDGLINGVDDEWKPNAFDEYRQWHETQMIRETADFTTAREEMKYTSMNHKRVTSAMSSEDLFNMRTFYTDMGHK